MRPAELKEWRKKLGLTQEEAGRRFGVSRVAEQNWENGMTPIPKSVEAATETVELEWKRRPEFGPVWLVYSDDTSRRSDDGIGRLAMMQRERFATCEQALQRAGELWGRPDFRNPFIQDEQGSSIWNLPRLRAEIERRNVAKKNTQKETDLIAIMNEIADHCSSLRVLDTRTDDEILGYDERGLPS